MFAENFGLGMHKFGVLYVVFLYEKAGVNN